MYLSTLLNILIIAKEQHGDVNVSIEDSDGFETPVREIGFHEDHIMLCADHISGKKEYLYREVPQ
jgi:hypothetical protein